MGEVGGAGSSGSNFSQMYENLKKTGKATQENVQNLVNEALKDGGLDKEERQAIFELGRASNDKPSFDPAKIKSFDGEPLSQDVKALFDMGKNNKKLENNVKEVQRDVAKSDSRIGGFFAEKLSSAENALYKGVKSAAEFTGTKEWLKRGHTGAVVDAARNATTGLQKWSSDYGITPNEQAHIDKLLGSIRSNGAHKADKAFTFQEFDNVKCVGNSLSSIQNASKKQGWDIPKDQAVNVSEDSLRKITGESWDAINVKDTENLRQFTNGKDGNQEGKAMVVDGGHAYVFNGFDEKNNIKVIDPSAKGDQNKTLERNNPSLTLYVQGKGDGTKTEAADATRAVHGADGMKPLPADGGKDSESFAIRKAIVFMTDPAKSAQFDQFKGKVEASLKSGMSDASIKDLSNFMKSNGMGAIDQRDLRAMVGVLTAKIEPNKDMGNKTNLLETFDWLNDKAKGGLTKNQTRIMSAVEYSNVNLDNYFSSFSGPGDKAQDMANILNAMRDGKKGC